MIYLKILLLGLLIFLSTACQKKSVIRIQKDSERIKQDESFVETTPTRKIEKLKFPIGTPKIVSDYGSLTGVNGKKRKIPHQGIDIHDLPGIPILAARDGTVVEVRDEKCWGLTIAIDHGPDPGGEKLYALYGHLGAHSVEEGEKVKRGQKIGEMGLS